MREQSILREPLRSFAKTMELKLCENDDKGGWEGCTLAYLTRRLQGEFGEVRRALKSNKSADEVERECADVANFAMMIADNYRRMEEEGA